MYKHAKSDPSLRKQTYSRKENSVACKVLPVWDDRRQAIVRSELYWIREARRLMRDRAKQDRKRGKIYYVDANS